MLEEYLVIIFVIVTSPKIQLNHLLKRSIILRQSFIIFNIGKDKEKVMLLASK